MWDIEGNDTNELTHKTERDSDVREHTYGWGVGVVRECGKDMSTRPHFRWMTTRSYCTAHGTLINITWQPGQEQSLGKNGYSYMYG